ncbi:uncharacterized protein K452DRAFT_99667 [Aplosporella prunicola CBS 121167]|uniref:Uncharacterized protein n=1 Tax=Aplosporella prunicola CBS 121167 TaxID=1176127 RepID=A0A6A6B0P9_9PEZI|nr:uncharacterized protein K452DRAFT_99667 [Aplosporella prunicola CBS 121167]KAF2137610.1 hypothetical protein K452DRAFT_99667 [Aplosporella prunicola CBS 121167]
MDALGLDGWMVEWLASTLCIGMHILRTKVSYLFVCCRWGICLRGGGFAEREGAVLVVVVAVFGRYFAVAFHVTVYGHTDVRTCFLLAT